MRAVVRHVAALLAAAVLARGSEARAGTPAVDSLLAIVTSATQVHAKFQPSQGKALKRRLGPEWVEAFHRTIRLDRIVWNPRIDPNAACVAPNGTHLLTLVFEGPSGRTNVEYDFANGLASFGTPAGRPGIPRLAWAREQWGEIKNLARQVFPNSGELRAVLLCPAPPPMPPPAAYVSPDRLDSPVEAIRKIMPVYPVLAREAGVDGTVLTAVLVGEAGRPLEARILRGNDMLNDAALTCVRQWEFKPPRAGGKPVAAWIEVPIRFSLR